MAYDEEKDMYHGGQVKLYENARLAARDLGSFLSCIFVRLRSTGFLYTSRNRLVPDLRDDIRLACSEGKVVHTVLPFEDNARAPSTDETALSLRPYQTAALRAARETSKSLLKLTTGTGKTVIAGHLLSRITQTRIVCIAPLLLSVRELQRRLAPFVPNHHVVQVDSEGTTDVNDIQSTMVEHPNTILFSTFKSFEEVIARLPIDFADTFLLIDEVHNCANKREMCAFANRFEHSLYLSATVPEELSETLDYETVYEYNIRDAIHDGNCVDYRVMLPYVDETAIPKEVGHLDHTLCNKALFLATGMLQEGKRRCVAYLPDTRTAKKFQRVVTEVFARYHGIRIDSYTVDCFTPKKKRKAVVDDFCDNDLSKMKVLCNVRIFNEAINLVPCDCVYKTEVGTNDITTVQQLGRAIRLDPNNPGKRATMFVWCTDWEDCLQSFELLKEQDPEFHRKLRVQSKDYDRTAIAQPEVRASCEALVKYVEIKCLTVMERWMKRVDAFAEFYDKKGSDPSQRASDEYEKKLGNWVHHMRKAYKKNKLSSEQIEKLESTRGWSWSVGGVRTPFDESIQLFVEFRAKKGSDPSRTASDEYEKKLGRWVRDMRQAYKKNKLSSEQIEKLEKIRGWSWGCSRAASSSGSR
jgi:superfamily II DNA or RNA helicase